MWPGTGGWGCEHGEVERVGGATQFHALGFQFQNKILKMEHAEGKIANQM